MACLCGMALSSPWMPPSCAPSRTAASPTRAQTSSQGPPSLPPPDASGTRHIQRTYPELERARRGRLVIVGLEVGGRFGTEAVQLLRLLARHRASTVPAQFRPSAIVAWIARWSGLLAVASQRAFAASLLELPPAAELGEGPLPELHEVLADSRGDA